jgi:uncharacterized protein (DUF1810 family)
LPSPDPFDLERFTRAQDPQVTSVEAELRSGQKRSHWMWYVFPQLRGLGNSAMAQSYGIASLEEARAYLMHPVLGNRLRECTRLVVETKDRSLSEIFGSPDDMKFRSSMTLFALASEDMGDVFHAALERFCSGRLDERTLALLQMHRPGLD